MCVSCILFFVLENERADSMATIRRKLYLNRATRVKLTELEDATKNRHTGNFLPAEQRENFAYGFRYISIFDSPNFHVMTDHRAKIFFFFQTQFWSV